MASRARGAIGRLGRLAPSLLAVCVLASGCGIPATAAGAPDAGEAAERPWLAARDPDAPVVLRWASVTYDVKEPAGAAVELRIILENLAYQATESTTILWDPHFAQNFRVLASEPAAWRVRLDERGWGVLDTAGVLPDQHGTFRVWFSAVTASVEAPRVAVVANGRYVAGEATAGITRSIEKAPPAQEFFEHGALAAAIDRLQFVPDDERTFFPVAVGMSLLFTVLISAGTALALHLASASSRPLAYAPGRPLPLPDAHSTRPVRSIDSTKKRCVNM